MRFRLGGRLSSSEVSSVAESSVAAAADQLLEPVLLVVGSDALVKVDPPLPLLLVPAAALLAAGRRRLGMASGRPAKARGGAGSSSDESSISITCWAGLLLPPGRAAVALRDSALLLAGRLAPVDDDADGGMMVWF